LVDPKCPGRSANAGVESTLVPCPRCGRTVELFGDELRLLCRCGQWVFREALPACFQWCPAADKCLGIIVGGGSAADLAGGAHGDPGRQEEQRRLQDLKARIAAAMANCPRPGGAGAAARAETGGKIAIPEPQQSYRQAFERGLEQLRSRNGEGLAELGARPTAPGRYELPVLDGVFVIDLPAGRVTLAGGDQPGWPENAPGEAWAILAVHYLGSRPPWREPSKWISFADLPEARGYNPVYRGRVLGRLCATAGRDRQTFIRACTRLGGERFEAGEEGFKFQVFPRVPVAIAWYSGDDEFRAGASLVFPENITDFFSAEDVVVLSESLVARLRLAASER